MPDLLDNFKMLESCVMAEMVVEQHMLGLRVINKSLHLSSEQSETQRYNHF